MKMRGLVAIVLFAGSLLAAAPSAPPTFSIALNNRTACVNPTTKHFARADAGSIDVQATPTGLTVSLAGSVAANAYLGHTGVAVECFHLSQDFEITCSDPSVTAVALTLDSILVGFVRSKFNGSACMKVASAVVTPAGFPSAPLAVAYPPMCVVGTDGRLCNQHIEPMTVQSLPLGKYVLTADFVLEAEASGLCDAHSAADFTSAAALPTDFVRMRDPFQNADKKNFGFSIALSAGPTGANAVAGHPAGDGKLARAAGTAMQATRPTPKSTTAPARTAIGVRFSPDTIR